MNLTELPLKFRLFIGIPLILSLISGYFYFFNQFWTHLDPKTFNYLSEYSGSRFRGHRGRQVLVHREFYDITNKINRYAVKNNLHLIITQSYRPPNAKIYDAVVTPAVKSNHLAGHAIDFNMVYGGKIFESENLSDNQFFKLPDAVKNFIGDIQADPAIRWGGDFENQDPVHLDDAVNINDVETWEKHYNQCVTDYMNATPKWRNWMKRVLNVLRLDNFFVSGVKRNI
jgi:hypothetical protein